MKILSTSYTLEHKSLDIYISGCKGNPHCDDCHNAESWNFDNGTIYNEEYFQTIKTKVKDFNKLINNIMIFGGEPLDQNHDDLIYMLKSLNSLNKKIWLFTRFNIEDVPIKVRTLCDYIKCGRYIKELKTDNNIQYGIKLATSNQKIYKKGVDYNV